MPVSKSLATACASLAAVAGSAIATGLAAVKAGWTARRHRRDVIGLLDFDDHMLSDLGLTRGDVHAALCGERFEDPSTRLRILAVERRAARRETSRERLRASMAADRPTTGADAPVA